MNIKLSTIDWVAISAMITAIMVAVTAWSLRNSRKQLRELQRQNFENTFFQLLRLVKETFNSCVYDNYRNKTNASDAFEKSYNALAENIIRRVTREGYLDEKTGNPVQTEFETDLSIENAKCAYRNFYDRFPDIGLYFRTLYRLIKMIDRTAMSDKEKYMYTSIVRAQLSDYELLWLFYNCTVGYGEEKFKTLVEKWVLLQNMREDKLADTSHYSWIDAKAFERNGRYGS